MTAKGLILQSESHRQILNYSPTDRRKHICRIEV